MGCKPIAFETSSGCLSADSGHFQVFARPEHGRRTKSMGRHGLMVLYFWVPWT